MPDSRISFHATPRVALPQVSSGEPSAFQNATRAAASSQSDTTASWLKPMPRCRSPMRRTRSRSIRGRCS
ncbi:hypothetical protein WK41_04375 [Burkholderia cepacia]|nr:hypothetical protein WK41_04375 [Burkholderia cepacia]